MKITFYFLIVVLHTIYLYPQVPIQYYDFEDNSDRSNTGELSPEIIINTIGGSSLSTEGGSLSTFAGNPSSGRAQQRGSWDGNGTSDPGIGASEYIQFTVDASGFSGIFVSLDAIASAVILGEINILYSTDGSNFSPAASQSLSSLSFEEELWDLSGVTVLDGSNITFRIYAFGDATGTATLTIDNLTIYANKITATKTLGNYQLIDDANGTDPLPVFNDFEIDGSGIQVSLASDLILDGTLTLTNGLILTDVNKVVLETGASIAGNIEVSYVVGSFAHEYSSDATKTFPLGALSGPHPFTLLTNGMTGSGEITVTEIDQNPGQTSLPAGIDKISNVRYWRLVKESSITSLGQILVRLVWDGDDGISDVGNTSVVFGTAGGNWTAHAEDATSGNSSSGYVEGNFFIGQPGDYTFGNLTGGGNALPVELSSFNYNVIKKDVYLSWQTKAEVNSYSFEIERFYNKKWQKIGEVKAHGNTNSPQDYSYTDKDLLAGNYSYRLKMIDNDGSFSHSPELNVEIKIPDDFALHQNYPNPFNPSTTIAYSLPKKSFVSLKVFNLLGKEITTLVNEEQPVGEYRIKFNMPELTSGVYIYTLEAGLHKETRKMIFMK